MSCTNRPDPAGAQRVVLYRAVIVQIRTGMCADSVFPLKSRMAIGKIRHVLTDLNGRMKHIPDTAADEGRYLVLARCAFAAAPLL
jgi:hypothetical protein